MRKRKGFTLVELMVVIAVIATLATVSVIGYRTFVRRETINASVTEADQSAQVIISQVASSNEGAIILRNKTTGNKLVNFGDIEFTYLNGNLQINSEIPDGKTNTFESIKEFDEALRYYFPSIMSLPGTFTMDTGIIYYHHLSIEEIEELFNKPNYDPNNHLEDGVGYDDDKYIYDKENPSTPYNVNDVAIDILSLDFMTIEESGNASGIESDGIKFSLTQSTILLKTNEDFEKGKIGYTYSGSDTPLSVKNNVKYDSKYLDIKMDENYFYLKGKRVTKQPIYVYFTVGRITKTLKVKITESGRTVIDIPKLMNTITWQKDHVWNATGTGGVSGKTYHKLEWDYGNGNKIATLVSCQEGEEPDTYTATFTIVDPNPEDDIEYCWADNFSYGTKVVKWRINKISIPEPIQVIYKDFDDMEYSDETIDLSTHTPDWDSVTANYIKNGVLSYTTARDDSKILLQTKRNKQGEKHGAWQDPGEYDANFKIEKPTYYQWADSVNVYKTVKWHVFKKQIDKPELIDSKLPYTFKRDTSVSDSVQGITYKLYEIKTVSSSWGPDTKETVYDKYFSHINSKIDLSGDLEASNAGEYTVKVSINEPGKYEWKTPSSEYKQVAGQDYYERKWNIALSNDYMLTWRILPAEVPIPQKSDLRIDFNGDKHTETITNYYNPKGYEDILEVKIENPNAINVGDYTANIHIKNSNYCWKVTDKITGIVDNADKKYTYHIDPVTISIPTLVDSDKYTFSYDKSTLEYKAVDVNAKLSSATVNGPNGTSESLTYDKYVNKYIKVKDGIRKEAGTKDIVLSLNNPANATQYNVKWSEGDTEIKKLEDKTISWTINPAEIDVSKLGITQIKIPTYSGSSITPQFNNVPNILKTNASSINASDNLTASFTVKDDFKDNFVIKESTNSVNWKIKKKEITPSVVTVEGGYTYNGNPITPDVTFDSIVEKDKPFEKGKDYTLSYTNNVDAAESTAEKAPTVTVALTTTITAKNYMLKSTTIKFTISKASSRIKSVPTARTGLVFTGEAQDLINAGEASNGAHLEYAIGKYPSAPTSGWSEDIPQATNKDTYDVCYKLVGDKNHLNGSQYDWVRDITIGAKDISEATVTGLESKTYTGSPITQTITVKVGNITLKNGTDYTISYSNNINVGSEATVTVTGKGNYEGTVDDKTFAINKKQITLKATDTEMVYGDNPSISYSKNDIAEKDKTNFGTMSYQAYDKDGNKVGTDGHISSTTPVGKYTIRISGLKNDNYDIKFADGILTIKPKTITATPSQEPLDYSDEGTYSLSFTFKDENGETINFKENDDYNVIFPKEVNCEKVVNVSLEFNSDKAKNYTVSPNQFGITINKIAASYIDRPSAKDLSYTGSPQELITAAQANGTVYYCAVQTNNGYCEYGKGVYTRNPDLNTFKEWASNNKKDSWGSSNDSEFTGKKGDIGYILCFIKDINNYGFIKVEHIEFSGGKLYTYNKGYEMFGTTIPKATNPGNYKVYYWLGGDNNHTDYRSPSKDWIPDYIEVAINADNLSVELQTNGNWTSSASADWGESGGKKTFEIRSNYGGTTYTVSPTSGSGFSASINDEGKLEIDRSSNDSANSQTFTITANNDNCTNSPTATINVSGAKDNSCLSSKTLITMADGSKKMIKNLSEDDKILAFNHETGKYEESDILVLVKSDEELFEKYKLYFDNGSDIEIINAHGLFDYTLKEYVIINKNNLSDYLGHKFVYYDDETKQNKLTEYIDYEVFKEYDTKYAVISNRNINAIGNNMLTMCDEIEGLYNLFKYDDDLKYNELDRLNKIKEYGISSYKEWGNYFNEDQYFGFLLDYANIAEGIGLTTKKQHLETFLKYREYVIK